MRKTTTNQRIEKTREELRQRVNLFCNNYGPGMFQDYDEFYRNYNQMETETDYDEFKQSHKPLRRQNSWTSMDLTLNIYRIFPSFQLQIWNNPMIYPHQSCLTK